MTARDRHAPSILRRYPDGSTVRTDFEALPLPPEDPYVLDRRAGVTDGVVSEITTEFAAAPSRPVTYPGGMFFLEDRRVWIKESPTESFAPYLRWRCTDPDVIIAAVIEKSIDEAYTLTEQPPPNRSKFGPGTVAVLRRGGRTRLLMKFEANDVKVVQLTESRY